MGDDYSADEFEDDKSGDDIIVNKHMDQLKERSLGDKYAVSMDHDEDDDQDLYQAQAGALKSLLHSKGSQDTGPNSSLRDTSRFGNAEVGDSFDNAFNTQDKDEDGLENFVVEKPKRAQWGHGSFGAKPDMGMGQK